MKKQKSSYVELFTKKVKNYLSASMFHWANSFILLFSTPSINLRLARPLASEQIPQALTFPLLLIMFFNILSTL